MMNQLIHQLLFYNKVSANTKKFATYELSNDRRVRSCFYMDYMIHLEKEFTMYMYNSVYPHEYAKIWMKGNWVHRKGLPAIEWYDGHQEWYLCGSLHRKDGPAVIYGDTYYCLPLPPGRGEWYYWGNLHREDGPAVIHRYATKWYLNGQLHRDNGPAIEHCTGRNTWYKHGKVHRVGGPAYEAYDGSGYWFHEGVEYTPTQIQIAQYMAQRAVQKM